MFPSWILTLMLALKSLHLSKSFHISIATRSGIRSKKIHLEANPVFQRHKIVDMSSHLNHRLPGKNVDLSGLHDNIVIGLARDLNLHKFLRNDLGADSISLDVMTPEETRTILADFVISHPEAERTIARLVLQYLGINKSVFSSHRSSSADYDVGASSDADLSQSPVSWLSHESWTFMSHDERIAFVDHLKDGKFRVPSQSFGKGIDRVVLGHGSRRVLVLVGIHGNEPCGVEAVKLILQRKALFSGDVNVKAQDLGVNDNWTRQIDELFDTVTIEFLIGNPAAVENNTRFLKKNLNRLLDIHQLCNDAHAKEEGYTYELERAKIVAESIRSADFVLDIHSTSANVGSFALPSSTEVSEQLAQCLPVKYVVESLAHMTLDGGTTLDCALLHDVPGITVECGQHSHPDIVSRAAAVISTFLASQIMDEEAGLCPQKKKPIVMKCQYAERVSHGFEWLNEFPEFHFVPQFTPVFRDDDRGDVLAPEGGAYIVMPTSVPVVGEEALFWALATT